MPVSTIDHESLFEQLADGLTLVTGNSRLARVLLGQYSHWRIARGDRQWESPDILPWDAWFDRLWEFTGLQGTGGTARRAVPGKLQLVNLWASVLRDDPRARHLIRPESLATRLRDTRRLVVDWRLDINHPSWSGDSNENHAAFRQWNQAFQSLCHRHGLMPPEDRIGLLSQELTREEPAQPHRIGLIGFDEFNPAQQELLAALADAGHSVRQLEIKPARPNARLWQSRSRKEELRQMARWVRYWFEKEPGSHIAVVVPDLETRRPEVERHLGDILTPGGASDRLAKPWNISMGTPLSRVPMVESAFDVLRLLDNRVGIHDICRVLRSPWINGGNSERFSRAVLEKCLRDRYPRQLKLKEIKYRAGEIRKRDRNNVELPPDRHEARPWRSPVLVTVIDTLMRFEREYHGARAPSAWAEAFDGLLSKVGWPAITEEIPERGKFERGENWQAFQAWQDVLRELASLDATLPLLSRKGAINQLLQVSSERIFQPRTPPATIQVLGLYEISGLRFDHLWVLGLHNENWPPAAQPSPFIPGVLQQKAQLPHSSPMRELEVARSITRRLLETADNCVFSYPGQADGEEILPSPLLAGDAFRSVREVEGWEGDSWSVAVNRAAPPQTGPLRAPGPPRHGTARGGSSILKHQALCPFRAFASNRLGADGLESPVDGITPRLHGSLVHRVLENFWVETGTLDALLSLDEGALEERIRQHVEQVVGDERSLRDRPEFRAVEGNRLARMTAQCLALEKSRGDFEVVGFEKEIIHEIEGQQIRLFIDRIDRLPGGEHVIIDYKTGKVDPKKWFGERPEDPQLPLYAISSDTTPAAIAFSVIRDGECLYRGVTTREGIFPGLPPRSTASNLDIIRAGEDLPATIAEWRATLHRLMAEFLAGDAAIDPGNGRMTCKDSFCDLQPLCRIAELEQLGVARKGETGG